MNTNLKGQMLIPDIWINNLLPFRGQNSNNKYFGLNLWKSTEQGRT